MDEIAADVGISTRQMERLFKNHVGVSPSEYFRYARLEIARELLMHTELQLVEVALAAGFSAYSPFQKAFRKHFGRNPGEYRART